MLEILVKKVAKAAEVMPEIGQSVPEGLIWR